MGASVPEGDVTRTPSAVDEPPAAIGDRRRPHCGSTDRAMRGRQDWTGGRLRMRGSERQPGRYATISRWSRRFFHALASEIADA